MYRSWIFCTKTLPLCNKMRILHEDNCNLRSRYFVLNINFDVSDSFVRGEATLMFY